MKSNFLVLAEMIEGGEWIALTRLFSAIKEKDPNFVFSLIAFKREFVSQVKLFKTVEFIKYSSIKGRFAFLRNLLKDFIKVRKSAQEHFKNENVDFIIVSD